MKKTILFTLDFISSEITVHFVASNNPHRDHFLKKLSEHCILMSGSTDDSLAHVVIIVPKQMCHKPPALNWKSIFPCIKGLDFRGQMGPLESVIINGKVLQKTPQQTRF